MSRRALQWLRGLLGRLAPGWHPSRSPLLGRLLMRYVAARRSEILPSHHGFELRLPRDHRSPLVVALYLDGEHEPEESRRILEILRPGNLAFDVGANIGYMTCLMAHAVAGAAGGEVHAFEPEPGNYRLLQENVTRNRLDGVKAMRLALSSAAGKETLYLARENLADHTLIALPERQEVSIRSQTFDDYYDGCCAGRSVRLVKIDVQGHEIEVLKGMRRSLGAGLVEFVLVEFWPARIRASGRRSGELFDFLRTIPYEATLIGDGGNAGSLAQIEATLGALERRRHRFFTVLLARRDGPDTARGDRADRSG